jgi:hypothetical protein
MKHELLDSFFLYLENKGYSKIVDYRNQTNTPKTAVNHLPDISAERKNVQYKFRFEDGSSTEHELIQMCKQLVIGGDSSNAQLKLLVPVTNYDTIIQMLNKHQMENVGVIRLSV